jgi:hypothetical protein
VTVVVLTNVVVLVAVTVVVLTDVVVEVLVIVIVGGGVVVVVVVVVVDWQVTVKLAYGYHSVTNRLLGDTVHPLPLAMCAPTTSAHCVIGPSEALPLPVM